MKKAMTKTDEADSLSASREFGVSPAEMSFSSYHFRAGGPKSCLLSRCLP